MTDLILYFTEDGRRQIKARAQEQTVWPTHLDIAGLFDATRQNISLQLKKIFEDAELDAASTVKKFLTVQTNGLRDGAATHPKMEANTDAIYREYDQRRKQDAMQADDADLKALENTIKHRATK